MTSKLRAVALAAIFSGAASMASAISTTPLDTPLSAGDSTLGNATAAAFESFGLTTLSFTAAEAMRAEISYTINPFLTDLAGTPSNTIDLAFSINGGGFFSLSITTVDVGVGTIGAGGVALTLDAGDTVSFFITGSAGQSGNQVTFAVETDVVPLAPAGVLGLTGVVALAAARRARKNKT